MRDLMLQTIDLCKRFGGVRALDRVTLTIRRGEVRAVIGPNGAGKSTLLRVLSGELYADSGQILYRPSPSHPSLPLSPACGHPSPVLTRERERGGVRAGEGTGGVRRGERGEGEQCRSISSLAPHQIARLGLGRTFQISELFEELTVTEALRGALARGKLVAIRKNVLAETLERFSLDSVAQRRPCQLSYGERRWVEIALVLAQEPKLCLLDEPTAGLSPLERAKMVELLLSLKAQARTLLIVEHDMDVVRLLADVVTVLHQGRVLAEGRPDEIRKDARVQGIYRLAG